jgi:hypothetical protein
MQLWNVNLAKLNRRSGPDNDENISLDQAPSGYNLPWSAPEIVLSPDTTSPTRPTKFTDVYSFGSVMLQVRYS